MKPAFPGNKLDGITLLCIGAGVFLRFYALGSQSLMIDESAYTLPLLKMPANQMIDALLEIGTNPPIYYLIQKAILPVAGYSEAGLRFFSALADSVSILIAAWLGYRLAGSPGRLAAAWFWAFNPLMLWMAQVGRPYAFSTMLAFALFAMFLQLRDRPGWNLGFLAVFAIVFTGLVTHYFFFMSVAALLGMAVLEFGKRRVFFRKWVVASLCGGLSLAIWLNAYFSLPNPVLGIGWIKAPSPVDFLITIWNLFSGYGGQTDAATLIFGSVALSLLMGAFLDTGKRPLSFLVLFGGLLAPLAAIWIFSQVRPIYIDRYLGPLLPFACALIAIGAGNFIEIKRPHSSDMLPIASAGLVLSVVGLLTGWVYHTDPKYALEDWRGLAGVISQEGDGHPVIWGSEAEVLPAFLFYDPGDAALLSEKEPPTCEECWYILRQPYTMLHAFTTALSDPEWEWKPDLPPSCRRSTTWTGIGLELWRVRCDSVE